MTDNSIFDFQNFDIESFDVATWDNDSAKGYDDALLNNVNEELIGPDEILDVISGNVAKKIIDKVIHYQNEGQLDKISPFIYSMIKPLAYIDNNKWHVFIDSLRHVVGPSFRASVLEMNRRIAINIKASYQIHDRDGSVVNGRRVIEYVSWNLADFVQKLEESLFEFYPGSVYQQYGRLVKISRYIQSPEWSKGGHETYGITDADQHYILQELSKCVIITKYDKKINNQVQIPIPETSGRHLLSKGNWAFYPLNSVLSNPILKPDGKVLFRDGYDFETGIYYAGRGKFTFSEEGITKEQSIKSRLEILDIFSEFKFKHKWGADAILSALLTVLCRYAVNGPVPAFVISSPTPGSGKSLLVDIISVICTDIEAPRWLQAEAADEERKRLTTIAMAGESMVLMDNCEGYIGSPALNAAITSRMINDRIMGVQKKVQAQFSSIVFFTGNNIMYKGDMKRRVVQIYLDPEMERPEERNDFRRKDILQYVSDNREELLRHCFNIVVGFLHRNNEKNSSESLKNMGTFEKWSNLVRSAIIWAGGFDPNDGKEFIEEEMDESYAQNKALLIWWEKCFNDKFITIRNLVNTINYNATDSPGLQQDDWIMLKDMLLSVSDKNNKGRLSPEEINKSLMKIRNRIFDGRRMVLGSAKNNSKEWGVQKIKEKVKIVLPKENDESMPVKEDDNPVSPKENYKIMRDLFIKNNQILLTEDDKESF